MDTSPRPFCFVLMPFSEDFADVYQIGIKEACEAAGAYCERVDEQDFAGSMLQRIYNQIAKADFIVADMTGQNPNVFYEVGYAHALGTRTILITKSADDIPFDLKHFPHLVYGSNKLNKLREELTKKVAWHVEHLSEKDSDSRIEIDLYSDSEILGDKEPICTFDYNQILCFPVTIHNRSSHTFEPGAFRIAVIVPQEFRDFYDAYNRGVSTAFLPDKRCQHLLPDFDTMFPDSYTSTKVALQYHPDDVFPGDRIPVVVRVHTPMGTRDFTCFADCVPVPPKE